MNTISDTQEVLFSKNAFQLSQAIHWCVTDLFNKGYKTVDPNLVLLASTTINMFDKHTLVQGFIENSHLSCWDNIKNRDEEFFVENSGNIFKYLPASEVNLFKDLFTTRDKDGNYVVDQSFKNQIWKLFDQMIKIAIRYIHINRVPYSTNESGIITNKYEREFFNNVDIQLHANTWGVKLEFKQQL